MKPPTFAPVYVSLFPHLAEIANRHGYAMAAHGSFQRDMDLVAIPWTDNAADAEALVDNIANFLKTLEGTFGTGVDPEGGEKKPHGRVAWLIRTGMGSGIDLSVMPRIKS